jgi:hypothetical protein
VNGFDAARGGLRVSPHAMTATLRASAPVAAAIVEARRCGDGIGGAAARPSWGLSADRPARRDVMPDTARFRQSTGDD